MRTASCITLTVISVLLLGAFLGSLDFIGEVRPDEVSVSRYRTVVRSEGNSGPPLFSALLERFQAFESTPPPLNSTDLPALFPDHTEFLLLRSPTDTPSLLSIQSLSASSTSLVYSTLPVNASNWRLEGLFWEEIWRCEVPGPVLSTAKCDNDVCAAVIYRLPKGSNYVDRIRFWANPEDFGYEDFELPGSGRISHLCITNSTVVYHRYQSIDPFILLYKLTPSDSKPGEMIYENSDYQWIRSNASVDGVYSKAEVLGLRYVQALDSEWVVLTTSFLPMSAPYSSDGLISSDLLYLNDSHWSSFFDYSFNYTFSPLLFAHQSVYSSVSYLQNTTLQLSLGSYPIQHLFLIYTWQGNSVSLRHLELADDIYPKFHICDPTGEYFLLISEELHLLRKWKMEEKMYQAVYRVSVEELTDVVGNPGIKGARVDRTEKAV